MRRTIPKLLLMLAIGGMSLTAQTPPPTPPPASTSQAPQLHADLNQLMRGLLYPAANVVFAGQADDPDELAKKPGPDPAMATDPIIAAFGGWQAVQNAALALAESANLIAIEGRRCANGTPVPTNDPAWTKFVQDLRDASMQAYAVAQTKNQEKMFEVSERLAANCSGCHRRWRDRRGSRCK